MSHSFTLEYWQDEGWFVGKLKEVPGVFSQGKTIKELKENIIDAYHLMIQDEEEDLASSIKNKIKQIQVEI